MGEHFRFHGPLQTSLQVGHVLVEQYATTALDLLLPAIEDGLVHDTWRIRQSSVELLGNLLFKLTGATGRIQTELL